MLWRIVKVYTMCTQNCKTKQTKQNCKRVTRCNFVSSHHNGRRKTKESNERLIKHRCNVENSVVVFMCVAVEFIRNNVRVVALANGLSDKLDKLC